jgi:NAD(P)-dependent dehydrogenase (short-subunit alcohol dehydrogenase family)
MMKAKTTALSTLLLLGFPCVAPLVVAFAVQPSNAALRSSSAESGENNVIPFPVAVAGATGKTGRLVVEQLLARGAPKVVALVRDVGKAQSSFSNNLDRLEIVQADFTKPDEISQALKTVDATIWCATGFSEAKPAKKQVVKMRTFFDDVMDMFAPKAKVEEPEPVKVPIDNVALTAIAKVMEERDLLDPTVSTNADGSLPRPRVVMCSSAGVTRPTWDEAKKEMLSGAADIPIVRLNPFGILDIKRESEEILRRSGVTYSIVRPSGLNDDWPAGSRPIFSQGDVAVGRMNRSDLARVLVDCLIVPQASGKTFEVTCVAGYPPPASIDQCLSRLSLDTAGPLSEASVLATYAAMQQLIPGEKQNPTALALGQTYEQLDSGETGRFGEKGQEDVSQVLLQPSS